MNKIIIITSHIDTQFDIAQILDSQCYVICTDGGYNIATDQGITPNLLLGDFDSIKGKIPENVEIKRFQPEKDYTDLDLALKTAMERNASEVIIVGGIGGRLDHTVANLQLLSHYSDHFHKITMLDKKNQCFVVNKNQKNNLVIPAQKDSYLSLFSLSEACTGVTIRGVKYPLVDHVLTRTFPLGVSNEFTQKEAILSIKDGSLLVVISKK